MTVIGEIDAIIEVAPEGGYWAISPEIHGVTGHGETEEEAKEDLAEAIRLLSNEQVEFHREIWQWTW